jgi:integrase
MFALTTWSVNQTKILTRAELGAVLADLTRRSRRSLNARLTVVIFHLACCCGLRASEIADLQLDDVRVGADRPHLRIRRDVAKGRRSRTAPLRWDAGMLADLAAWKAQCRKADKHS